MGIAPSSAKWWVSGVMGTGHSPVVLASLQVQSPLDAARKRWILALTCLAQFMVILDVSVVNVALPSIRYGSGASGL